MGAGDFALIMVVQSNTPLATLVAQVAEVQWPMGKDGPVLKIANLRYAFALPGLLYGLLLPDSTPQDLMLKFEKHIRRCCTFEIRPEVAKAAGVSNNLRLWYSIGGGVDMVADEIRYWTAVAGDVEDYSTKLLRQLSSRSKSLSNLLKGSDSRLNHGIKLGELPSNEVSLRMRKRVDQARRMSAVAKLLSRTVLKGAISATGHVANFVGGAILSGKPCVQAFMSSESKREVALASVDAFAKIVEAVETAGRSVIMVTSSDVTQVKTADQLEQGKGNDIDTLWTLNKVGLRMLWQATAASTALNANRFQSAVGSPVSESSVQSSGHVDSSTTGFSMSKPLSQVQALSPPTHLHTAQLFPSNTSASPPTTVCSQSSPYAIPSPNFYMDLMPPVYTAYYNPAAPHHPNSPFQQYTRPNGPPQMKYFLPCAGLDGSSSP